MKITHLLARASTLQSVTTFSHDGRGPLQVATYPLLTTYSLQTHIQRSEVAACKGLIKDPIRQLLRGGGGGKTALPFYPPPPRNRQSEAVAQNPVLYI